MIGDLSARYESNGDSGRVSSGWGDAGGVSYGCYQLASNAGSVDSFIEWLGLIGHNYHDSLGALTPGTQEFTELWQHIAEVDGENFKQLQHDYIQYAYYEPAVEVLRENYFNIDNHNEVMKDVVWSRAVQYGAGQVVEMFTDAVKSLGYPNLSYVDSADYDERMIRAIYINVCSTPEWTNGSPSLRDGLYNRFANECEDAIAQL